MSFKCPDCDKKVFEIDEDPLATVLYLCPHCDRLFIFEGQFQNHCKQITGETEKLYRAINAHKIEWIKEELTYKSIW